MGHAIDMELGTRVFKGYEMIRIHACSIHTESDT